MKPLSIAVREDAMVPLDRWLATQLAQALNRPVPRGLTRKAIVGGLIAVAGRIVRFVVDNDAPVEPGQVLALVETA